MIGDLNSEASVALVVSIGRRYVQRDGMDPEIAAQWVAAIARSESADIPEWLFAPADHPQQAAENAKAVLEAMLNAPDADLRRIATEEIDKARVSQGQVVDPITLSIAGGYLLGLAVLSKVTYSEKAGWALAPGFPGLANVLGKLGGVLKHLNPFSKK